MAYRKHHAPEVIVGVAYLVVKEGHSVSDVARWAGVSRPTVYRWIKQVRARTGELDRFKELLAESLRAVIELGKVETVPPDFVAAFRRAALEQPWRNVRWLQQKRAKLEERLRAIARAP